jgi:hypothetical protein
MKAMAGATATIRGGPMRFSILGLIGGGLLGTVAGGLGSAFGTCLFIAGVWTLGWPRGWEAATVLAASLFPALGGFIGGTTAGACGRIGFLRPAIGGALGAWLQGGALGLLMALAADHDLIGYPTPLVYGLLLLTGAAPVVVGAWLSKRPQGKSEIIE